MIDVELPDDRTLCGTLRLRNVAGDVLFGPVPIAGRPRTPSGTFRVSIVSRKNHLILLDATETLAIQSQSVDSGEKLYEPTVGLRLSNRHMHVLLDLLDLYDFNMHCSIRPGPGASMRVRCRDDVPASPDNVYLRRLSLARTARNALK